MKSDVIKKLVIGCIGAFSSVYSIQTVGISPYGLSRLSLRHKEYKGIGYQQGYTTVGMFISGQGQETPFGALIDMRAHVFNDFSYAGNLGMGFRVGDQDQTYSFGVNGYYDFRWKEFLESHQLGVGIEVLTRHVDIRLNGYKPLVGKYYDEPLTFSRFKNHQIMLSQYVTYALPMVDAEVGFSLPDPFDQVGLYLGIGGYYLFKQKGYQNTSGDVPGGKIRLQASPSPYLSFTGEYTYDKLFKGRGNGAVSINIPLGRVCHEKILRKHQIPWALIKGQDVVRQEIIPYYRTGHEKSLTHQNGHPLKIHFIDNTAEPNGDGSYEKPYNELKKAHHQSAEGDYFYLFYGDGSSKGYDEGFEFKSSQALIGSGLDVEIAGVVIPAKTPFKMPQMTSFETSVITMKDVESIRLEGVKVLAHSHPAIKFEGSSGVITNNCFEGSKIEDLLIFAGIGGNTLFQKNEIRGDPSRSLVYLSNPSPAKEGYYDFHENLFIATGSCHAIYLENSFQELNFKKNTLMGADPSKSGIKVVADSEDLRLARYLFEQNSLLTGFAQGSEVSIKNKAFIQCEYVDNAFLSDSLISGIVYENQGDAADLTFDGNQIKAAAEGISIKNHALETRMDLRENEIFLLTGSPAISIDHLGDGKVRMNDNIFSYLNSFSEVFDVIDFKGEGNNVHLFLEAKGNEFCTKGKVRDLNIDLKKMGGDLGQFNCKISIEGNKYSSNEEVRPILIDHYSDHLHFILDAADEEMKYIEVISKK